VHFRCRIIGGGPDRERLQSRIDAADMGTTVLLLGPRVQEDVAEILSSANCYAQPSVVTATGQMEGIPVSLMEAMASGLPVVATRLSGVPELVRPGDTGWLVAPRDAPALADALQEIGLGEDRTAVIARRGRRLVEREFTVDGNVDRLTELLTLSQPVVAARQDAA
jgi:glycosyltransferase involved in cell wall biosynthesis